jgi:hypothetical protein
MEASLIAIIVALTVMGLGHSFTLASIWDKRAAANKKEAPATGEVNAQPPTSAPPVYEDDTEIPAALVGARCKETIERFAPAMGMTPANLLRAALIQGLTGGRPIADEILELLKEEEEQSLQLPKTSKSGPPRPN